MSVQGTDGRVTTSAPRRGRQARVAESAQEGRCVRVGEEERRAAREQQIARAPGAGLGAHVRDLERTGDSRRQARRGACRARSEARARALALVPGVSLISAGSTAVVGVAAAAATVDLARRNRVMVRAHVLVDLLGHPAEQKRNRHREGGNALESETLQGTRGVVGAGRRPSPNPSTLSKANPVAPAWFQVRQRFGLPPRGAGAGPPARRPALTRPGSLVYDGP